MLDFISRLTGTASKSALNVTFASWQPVRTTTAKLFSNWRSAFPSRPRIAGHGQIRLGRTRRRMRRAVIALRRRARRLQAARKAAASIVVTGPHLTYRTLEPRMVFDGAAVATADAVTDVPVDAADTGAAEQADAESQQLTDNLVAALGEPNERNEIAFVDQSVQNVDQLIAQLPPEIDVVLIDSDSDGLEQIAATLADRQDVDAIHIISHGDQGRLYLGNDVLDAESMHGEHLDELTAIGQALSADGDILIYGCDFTGGDAGLEAAILLGSITGADIAASEDTTGHADLGGDWDLETQVGAVETQAFADPQWLGLLAPSGPILVADDGGNDDVTQDPNDITAVSVDYTNSSSGSIITTVQIDPIANTGSNTSNLAFVFDTDGDGDANYGFAITLGNNPFEVTEFSLFYGKGDNFAAKISGKQTTIGQWDSTSGWTTGMLSTTFAVDTVAEDPFDTSFDTRVTLNIQLDDILTHWQSVGNPTATYSDIQLLNATTQPSHSASSDPKDLGIEAAPPYNAINDTATTDEDTPVTIDVAANDSAGLAPSTVEISSSPANGTVVVNGDGTVTYTPNSNFSGNDTFQYQICGLDGQPRTATATITVNDVNDPPVANPSTSSGNVDTDIAVGLTGSDIDGTIVSVTVSTLPPVAEGVLYLSDGTTPVVAGTPITAAQAANLVFTPAANFNGTVTIPFTVTDDDGATSAPANEVITVNDVNDPPTANPSTSSGDEDTDISVDLTGTDSDGTIVSVTVTTLPPASEGVLYLSDGTTPVVAGTPITAAQAASLVFTPAADFNGTVTIPFTVTDDDGATSAPANEVITVNDVNDPPTANPSTSSGDEDTDIAVDLTGTDSDGTIASVTVTTLPPASEGVLYLSDGTTPVVAGTPITAAQAASLVFTPAANFNGTVTIPFTVTDDDGATSAPANEVITVNDVNDPPTANPSTSSGDEDTDIAVALTGTDIDGTVVSVTVTTLPPAAEGVLYLSDGTTPVVAGTPITAAQAANLVFTPAADFNGTVTIPFTVTDDDGATSAPANEVITVNDVNDPPTANPSTSSGDEDTDISVDLTGTDSDGTIVSVTVTTLPPASEGVLYLSDGTTPVVAGTPITAAQAASLVFTPAANFNGTVTIPFTVTDDDGATSAPANEVITVNDVNDPPTANPSTSSGDEDTDIAVDLTGTDSDGTIVSVTVTTLPPASEGVLYLSDGTTPVVAGTPITAAQAASLVFTPAANFNGTVTIPFTVTDDDGATSAPANEVITVNDVNDPPTANPSTSSGDEDTDIAVDLTGTDIDGTVVSVTVTTLPPASEGVLYLSDGTTPVVAGTPITAAQAASLVFTPAADFNGTVTIPFTVTDDDGATSAPANEVITVNDVNDPPTANPSTSSGDEDTDIAVDLTGTDSDGTIVSVTVTTLPPASEGVLYLSDGTTPVVAGTPITAAQAASLVFTPAANFNGTVTIPFTVTDDDGATSAPANEVITVNDVNDPPTANPSTSSGDEDTDIAVDLTGTDIDGTVVSVTVTTLPPASEGVLYLSDGTTPVVAGTPITAAQAANLVFTPAANFNGTVTIPFTVTDDDGATSAPANEVITVNDVNDPPTANPSTSSGDEDTDIAVDLTGTDIDGTVVSVTVTTLPPASEGVLYLSDGTTPVVAGTPITAAQAANLVFTPAANFNGTVTIPFTVTDDDGATSAPANEVITVNDVNDPPTANPSTSSGDEDTDIAVDLTGTDIDGTVVSVTVTTLPPASEGVLYLSDGTTPVVAGTPITAAQAANLVFTPAANFNGTVTIPFTVTDDDGATSAPANEVITVNDVNDPPTANPSTSSGDEDTDIAVALTGSDVDGTIASVTVTTLPPASEGILYLSDGTTPVVAGTPITAAQAASLVFTPAANFNGTVTIPFTVTDDDGATSAPANEVITVNDVNDPPTANPSTSSGDEDTDIAVDLTGTDSDGTIVSVTVTTLPPASEGVLYLSDGTTPVVAGTPITAAQAANLVFTPAADFNGTVTIPFTVTDDDGATSAPANEVITVNDVNDPPTANPSTSSGDEDTDISVALTGSDSDGTVVSVTVTTLPPATEGVLYLSDGTTPVVAGTPITAAQAANLVFTPAADFNGTVTIPFTVTDDDGATSAPANEVITVNDVNDPPTANPSTSSGDEDTDIAVDLTGTDSDGTIVSVTVTTLPPASEGVLYLSDGTTPVVAGTPITAAQAANLVFTPAANFNGTVTIPFTVTDDDGATSAPANEVITVNDVNDPPTANPSTSSGDEDTDIAVDLTGTDIDGTVVSVTVTTLPPAAEGVLYLSDGTTPVVAGTPITAAQAANLVFTPAANFNGTVTIPFTVTDDDGATSAPANEVITVNDVNDPPTANPSTSSGDEDTDIAVDLTGTDSDGTIVSVTVTTLPPASEGVLHLSDGTTPVVAGTPITAAQAASLVFTPAANFNGTVTIPFTVTDDDGATSAPANEVITVNDVNDPPTANPSTSSGDEDTDIAVDLTGTDSDGTIVSVTVTTLPPASEGVLYLSDGTTPVVAGTPITAAQAASLVFTPAANFNGTVTIPFTVTDDDGATSAPANEVITVNDVNDPPTANPSTSSGDEDTDIAVDLTGTDSDGTIVSVTVTTLPPASEGVLYLSDGTTPVVAGTPITAAQAASLVFTPAANFNGTVTIPFTVTDDDGATSAPANEVITVNDVNDPPTANDDSATIDSGQTVTIDVLANDTDLEGDTLTVVAASATSGTVIVNADGTLTYQPVPGFVGLDTITYTISDGQGGTATATVQITVIDRTSVITGTDSPPDSAPAAVTFESISADGAVLDALAAIDGRLTGAELSSSGIVVSTANSLQHLNGIEGQTFALDQARIWQLEANLRAAHGAILETYDVDGLTGFSLRIGLLDNFAGSSDKAQVVIESLVRDEVLILQLSNTSLEHGKAVVEYRITQANGQPLPGWFNKAGDSLYLGERPADVDTLQLRLIVFYEDGTSDSRAIEIHAQSGEMKPLPDNQAALTPKTFDRQFNPTEVPHEDGVEDLADMLKRRA